jgi:hypothetical protein
MLTKVLISKQESNPKFQLIALNIPYNQTFGLLDL